MWDGSTHNFQGQKNRFAYYVTACPEYHVSNAKRQMPINVIAYHTSWKGGKMTIMSYWIVEMVNYDVDPIQSTYFIIKQDRRYFYTVEGSGETKGSTANIMNFNSATMTNAPNSRTYLGINSFDFTIINKGSNTYVLQVWKLERLNPTIPDIEAKFQFPCIILCLFYMTHFCFYMKLYWKL